MAIICSHCNYHMTKSEVSGYALYNTLSFTKEILAKIYLDRMSSRRSMLGDSRYYLEAVVEDFMIGILNSSELCCHACKKYHQWIRVNQVPMSKKTKSTMINDHTYN